MLIMAESLKILPICLLLFIFAGSRISTAQEYRLNTDVVPVAYDIAIKPYLQSTDGIKQFTFDGEVNITLKAEVQNVKNITLHKAQLEILETVLYDTTNGQVVERITSDRLEYDEITNKLTIPLQTSLDIQLNYTLYFKYSGQIRNDLAGIFRGSYDNVNWYALTQLHRIDARTAFPCFDEPQIKATFQMRITRPKEYQAYFNTRLLRTTAESDDRYTDYFAESPRMSTYLVALLVVDFMVEGNNDFKLILIPSMNENETAFTHEVALKTMEAYDNYTQMPYQSLGNDIMQMAGSNSFPHSGMENWGLIMYKDSILVQEPGYTDGWSHKEYTIMLLVHEVAHMWFGNSVTHKWWGYFWLNEAFPSYYQYILANEIYPEYELDKQFVLKQTQYIFDMDATNMTQPLTSPEELTQTPTEIGHKFSDIAYNKGAAVVRMMANAMGKENFDNSIREYLKVNHLKNTVPEDLFLQWTRHWPMGQQVDLNQLFSDWTEQPGYPMINISTTTTGRYILKQQRFLLDPTDGSDVTLNYTVPITYATNREQNFEDLTPKFYFNKTDAELEFGDSKGDEWIVLNLQQSNYHRVFYEAPLLDRLRKAFMAANHSGIHLINRAQVVDDLFTYGRIDLLGYDEVFAFMEYLAGETEYLPWQPAFKGFEVISQRLTLDQHTKFGKFLFDILSAVYKKLGFENSADTVLDVYNRNKVITWLCKYQHDNCNDEAQRQYFLYRSIHVPVDFQETLYCAACRYGSFDIYYSLSTMFKTEELKSQREKILRTMGCTRHFVEYHYAFIMSDNTPQDLKVMAITSLYSQTPENVQTVYNMVTENVEFLAKTLNSWADTATIISGIANYLTTDEQLVNLKEFVDTKGHLFGTSISLLENAVKTVEKNLAWSEKYLGNLFQYLDGRSSAISISNMVSILPILAIAILSYLTW